MVTKGFLMLLLAVIGTNVVFASIGEHRQVSYANDSIVVKKTQRSKLHKIKVYPNVTHDVLFFTADGEEGKVYQLFVFDMDGKLSKQTQVRNHETTLLSRFEKGNYVFEVFSNDDRIENGIILVK